MRYPASEKLEIIRTVEQSHLSARQTPDKIGIPLNIVQKGLGYAQLLTTTPARKKPNMDKSIKYRR